MPCDASEKLIIPKWRNTSKLAWKSVFKIAIAVINAYFSRTLEAQILQRNSFGESENFLRVEL